MSLWLYLHTRNERAETSALLDSGATENFIHLDYAWRKWLTVKQLVTPRKIVNVDKTPNTKGEICYYVDLDMNHGTTKVCLHFFLTDIGDWDIILGYPWFAAVQPNIDWARGWIATEQLPVILQTQDANKAHLDPRQRNIPRQPPDHTIHVAYVTFPAGPKQTKASQLAEQDKQEKGTTKLPEEYACHKKVFSKEESQWFPGPRIWDHAIELKKDAPSTLPGKIYSLTQPEQKALE